MGQDASGGQTQNTASPMSMKGAPAAQTPGAMKGAQGQSPGGSSGVSPAQPAALSGFAPGFANGIFGINQGYNGGMGSVSSFSSASNPQNPALAAGGQSTFPTAFPAQSGQANP